MMDDWTTRMERLDANALKTATILAGLTESMDSLLQKSDAISSVFAQLIKENGIDNAKASVYQRLEWPKGNKTKVDHLEAFDKKDEVAELNGSDLVEVGGEIRNSTSIIETPLLVSDELNRKLQKQYSNDEEVQRVELDISLGVSDNESDLAQMQEIDEDSKLLYCETGVDNSMNLQEEDVYKFDGFQVSRPIDLQPLLLHGIQENPNYVTFVIRKDVLGDTIIAFMPTRFHVEVWNPGILSETIFSIYLHLYPWDEKGRINVYERIQGMFLSYLEKLGFPDPQLHVYTTLMVAHTTSSTLNRAMTLGIGCSLISEGILPSFSCIFVYDQGVQRNFKLQLLFGDPSVVVGTYLVDCSKSFVLKHTIEMSNMHLNLRIDVLVGDALWDHGGFPDRYTRLIKKSEDNPKFDAYLTAPTKKRIKHGEGQWHMLWDPGGFINRELSPVSVVINQRVRRRFHIVVFSAAGHEETTKNFGVRSRKIFLDPTLEAGEFLVGCLAYDRKMAFHFSTFGQKQFLYTKFYGKDENELLSRDISASEDKIWDPGTDMKIT